MKTIIGILTKSPHPEGRIGPKKYQDWYRQCVDAVALHTKLPFSVIVVTSALQIQNAEPEEAYYIHTIGSLDDRIFSLGKGVETIEQLLVFKKYAEEKQAHLVLLVTFTHFLRVIWLSYRIHLSVTQFKISWGIPRPKELVTDIILTFLYPLLDLCGRGEWFMGKVQKRRRGGKF